MSTSSEDYIQYICSLYNDYYDDRIENSRPPAAGDQLCIPGADWNPGQSAEHKSLSAFQCELEKQGIHLSTSKIKRYSSPEDTGHQPLHVLFRNFSVFIQCQRVLAERD